MISKEEENPSVKEELKSRTELVNAAESAGLGFSRSQIQKAVSSLIEACGNIETAKILIPSDNFSALVDYILEHEGSIAMSNTSSDFSEKSDKDMSKSRKERSLNTNPPPDCTVASSYTSRKFGQETSRLDMHKHCVKESKKMHCMGTSDGNLEKKSTMGISAIGSISEAKSNSALLHKGACSINPSEAGCDRKLATKRLGGPHEMGSRKRSLSDIGAEMQSRLHVRAQEFQEPSRRLSSSSSKLHLKEQNKSSRELPGIAHPAGQACGSLKFAEEESLLNMDKRGVAASKQSKPTVSSTGGLDMGTRELSRIAQSANQSCSTLKFGQEESLWNGARRGIATSKQSEKQKASEKSPCVTDHAIRKNGGILDQKEYCAADVSSEKRPRKKDLQKTEDLKMESKALVAISKRQRSDSGSSRRRAISLVPSLECLSRSVTVDLDLANSCKNDSSDHQGSERPLKKDLKRPYQALESPSNDGAESVQVAVNLEGCVDTTSKFSNVPGRKMFLSEKSSFPGGDSNVEADELKVGFKKARVISYTEPGSSFSVQSRVKTSEKGNGECEFKASSQEDQNCIEGGIKMINGRRIRSSDSNASNLEDLKSLEIVSSAEERHSVKVKKKNMRKLFMNSSTGQSFLEQIESFLRLNDTDRALQFISAWKGNDGLGQTLESRRRNPGQEAESSGGVEKLMQDVACSEDGFVVSYDISRGLERFPISCVNEYNTDVLPEDFLYITSSVIAGDAHVNASFSRIGDMHCSCNDDCLLSTTPCKCTDSTRGEYAYERDGLLISRLAVSFVNAYGTGNGDFITECCSKCRCNMKCRNRVVQRGIVRKLQVFMTPNSKGWGVRALEVIPARAFIFEYIGEIATNEEQSVRNETHNRNKVHTYTMNLDADFDMEQKHFNEGLTDTEALVLDATNFGNVSRFINHRCTDANLFFRPVQIETRDTHCYHVAFFAVRQIEKMEELTWDYGIDFADDMHQVKAFRCLCGSKFCRDARGKR